jgi:SAM-dependent methyltransferase
VPTHSHSHSATLLPRLLQLDAVVHASVLARTVAMALELAPDTKRIVDVGSGTGTGTFALSAAFPKAQVTAVDSDEDMLTAVRRGAIEQKLSDRIATDRADIAAAAPNVRGADLVWSSNAMHEVSDPSAAYRNLFQILRPGGALLIAEMDAPPTVLPQTHAPLESALRTAAGANGPAPDWFAAIAAAGFKLITTQTIESDQALPADGPGGAYAALELRRLAQHALPRLSNDEVAALRRLTADLNGWHELLEEVRIRGTRTIWTARRP